MAVTIRDVAARSGVSPSTVSRVCTGNPSISKETRDRVRKVMAELGYEPSSSPALQPEASHRSFAVVMPPSSRDIYGNPFFMEAIRGICEFCNPRKIAVSVVTACSVEEALGSVRNLSRSVDGFILLYSREDDPVVEYLCDEGLLYVVVGTPIQLRNQTICIDNDNVQCSREATDYLYNLGHRKIAFIGTDPSYLFSQDRKGGYQLSMIQHGITCPPEYTVDIIDILEEGDEKLRRLLSLPDRPTAILTGEDIIAMALYRVCIQMGLSVPGDVSILTFNNSIFCRMTVPQLTCLDVNSFQLGFEAASQALNHAENSNLMAARILVHHQIIERGSCRKI